MIDWPQIAFIEKKRLKLNLTQQALSRESGIPQAVISRIEKGKIRDPAYVTVQKIFDALDRLERNYRQEESPHAEKLMGKHIVCVKPNDRTALAWKLMREHHFSQLPVIDERERILGCINEHNLMTLTEDKRVEEVMSDPFPIVGKCTSIQTLASLLRNESAVLVAEKGKAIGIITKYDLVENAFKHSIKLFR